MPKKLDKPVEMVSLKLFEGDRDTLKQFYPMPLGYNAAARQIIHHHCNKLRERASREGVSANVRLTDDTLDALGLTPESVIASAAGDGDGGVDG